MKITCNSLVISKTQVKTTRFHFMPIEPAEIYTLRKVHPTSEIKSCRYATTQNSRRTYGYSYTKTPGMCKDAQNGTVYNRGENGNNPMSIYRKMNK